jgi:hypothetical protein
MADFPGVTGTFIPNYDCFPLPEMPERVVYSRPVLITVVNDFRLRFNGEPLPGDRYPLKDGTPGIVIGVRRTETGYAICLAPAALVDRNKYLEAGTPIPVPLKDPMFEPEPNHVVGTPGN